MKKFFIIILLFIACFVVEGVFIFKSGNNQEAKLESFNENEPKTNDTINEIVDSNEEETKGFK